MPYIKQEERDKIDTTLQKFVVDYSSFLKNPGNLNFVLTKIALAGLEKVSYTELNKIVGVLECVNLEFYRRLVSKYEDIKILENGDVSTLYEYYKKDK